MGQSMPRKSRYCAALQAPEREKNLKCNREAIGAEIGRHEPFALERKVPASDRSLD